MEKIMFRQFWLPLTFFACAIACAQTPASETNSLNRFSASYRMMFNVNVSFGNLGGFVRTVPGPATGGTENRYYDDGYNLVDNNNNSYGELQATRNWGYDNASQIVDNRYIVMHSSSSPAGAASSNRNEDPQHGFELVYQREMARNEKWNWGLEGAFGMTWISVNDARPLAASLNRVNDSFEVPADESGFRFIPPPGHRGSDREGPLLGSEPSPPRTTSVIPGGASITGRRIFDADLYGFRLGVYAGIPLGESVLLTLSGGLALAQVDSNFKFSETVTIADLGSVSRSGSGSHNDLLAGGYVAASVAVALNKNKDWNLVGGLQFQDLGRYSHNLGGKQAVLDLSQALFVGIGVSHSF